MILAVLLLPRDAALRRRSLLDQVFGAAAARIGAADLLKCYLFKPAREHAQPTKLHRDFAGEVMRRAENFHAHSFDSGRRGILVEMRRRFSTSNQITVPRAFIRRIITCLGSAPPEKRNGWSL